MAKVQDVAKFIQDKTGANGLRLQKLLYYCQAWSLVWSKHPLFDDRIEAWEKGPVSPHVFGEEKNGGIKGDSSGVLPEQLKAIEAVLGLYGDKSGEWLSRLAHREQPWKTARGGLSKEASSKAVISQDSIQAYYSSIPLDEPFKFTPEYADSIAFLVELPEDEVDLLGDHAPAVNAEQFLKWMETGDEEHAPA